MRLKVRELGHYETRQPDFCRRRTDALQIGMNPKHVLHVGSPGRNARHSPIGAEELPLTVRDAAVYLGVSGQTVYLWVERKQIPHLRVMGRNIRFLRSDLEPFRTVFKQPAVACINQSRLPVAFSAPEQAAVEREGL